MPKRKFIIVYILITINNMVLIFKNKFIMPFRRKCWYNNFSCNFIYSGSTWRQSNSLSKIQTVKETAI